MSFEGACDDLFSFDFGFAEEFTETREVAIVLSLMNYSTSLFGFRLDSCLPEEVLIKFIDAVRDKYAKNPYHNFQHALCVMHFVCLMMESLCPNKGSGALQLEPIQAFGLIVAAFIHDVEHRGYTNSFEINSQSELALTYNDMSVLENHHTSVGCKLVAEHLFPYLTPTECKSMREVIIVSILATDMGSHNELLAKLKTYAERNKILVVPQVDEYEDVDETKSLVTKKEEDTLSSRATDKAISAKDSAPSESKPPSGTTPSSDAKKVEMQHSLSGVVSTPIVARPSSDSGDSKILVLDDVSSPATTKSSVNFKSSEGILLLCRVLVHGADLSNPTKPFQEAQAWARRVRKEFNAQIEVELSKDLPVLPFFAPDDYSMSKNEISFGTFVCLPMWKLVGDVLPELAFLAKRIEKNISEWEVYKLSLEPVVPK